MVNKAEQPQEQPIQDPVNVTTDITQDFEGSNTSPEGTTDTVLVDTPSGDQAQPEATEQQPTSAPAPVSPAAVSTPTPAPTTDINNELESRLKQTEQQNIQYQAQQQQAELLKYRDDIQKKYEEDGYDQSQAKKMADDWAVQENQIAAIAKDQQQKVNFILGQANAAEHFAKQYDLQLADLTELRRYNDPQAMETAAKRMQSDRTKDARIAELEAKLVPTQNYDDSQSTPAASTDEDRWLERYNQGDRSNQASAAARRAAGLG